MPRSRVSDATVIKGPRVVAGVCAVLFLSGCSATGDVNATQLTIATTASSLDHATALAVAEYVTDQGAVVEIEQYDEPDDVFANLEEQTEQGPEHVTIGVLTAHQDPELEDHPLRVPDGLEVVAQAPAELGLVPAASTVTMARFAQHHDEDAAEPLAPACKEQTWLHAHTPEHEIDTTVEALADLGCEPTFEPTDSAEAKAYDALAQRLTVEHDTVALMYGIDPMIPDQGLATLDVVTEQWPHSNVVAVTEPDLEDPLLDHVEAVLEVLDSDSATGLLRGYHDAEGSSSDLDYTVGHAIRYWLANHDLIDHDTVSDISTEND